MIDLPLSSDHKWDLIRTLRRPHAVGVELHVLDLEHQPMGRLTGRTISGQMNMDATADVTRQLSVEIVDPKGVAAVETQHGKPRLDRMIRCYYMVYVAEPIWDWVAIPVFTGPITSVSREGDVVSIEAQGKESLAQGPTWRPRTFAKGLNRVNVIRVIMQELAGESRFRFPTTWPARTAKRISMSRNSAAWSHALIQARGMAAHLFYDGRGSLRLRKRPVRPAFTFTDGEGGMVLEPPKVTDATAELTNAWRVIGGVPKGKKKAVEAVAFLDASIVGSPHNMKRGDKPKYYPEEITDDTLRTKKDVQKTADRLASTAELDSQTVEFTSLPYPLLEEEDPIALDLTTVDVKLTTRLTKMSLPLGHAGVMTVGYLAPVSKRKRR